MELSRFVGHIASNDLPIKINAVTRTGQAFQCACRSLCKRDLARTTNRLLRLVRLGLTDRQLSRPIVVEERLILAVARDRKNRPLCTLILHDGRFNALCFICFNLLQKLGILSCLFCKKIVNKAQVQLVGVRVGVAARVAVSARFALIRLVLPNVGLHGHKKLADVGIFAVVEVGHHPLDVFDGHGIHLTEAAVRECRLQYSIRIRAGAGCPRVRIKE